MQFGTIQDHFDHFAKFQDIQDAVGGLKDDLFLKNTRKDEISSITEKDDIHPRKDDIGILD